MNRPPDGMPRVVSINLGRIREIEWRGRVVRTAIWKQPVGERPVIVRGVTVEGDEQADLTVHGGADKAVYAYATEDYRYWSDAQGVQVEPGLFGENLTTEGIDLRSVLVGERWRVGSALLEVTRPRLPCYKLGIRLGDPMFPKRFFAVARFGAYLRIVRDGEIRAGDAIEVSERPDRGMRLSDLVGDDEE